MTVTDTRNDEIISLYEGGLSVVKIANDFNVSRQRIYQILEDAGVKRSVAGEASRQRKQDTKEQMRSRVIATYAEVGTVSGTITSLRGECSSAVVREILGPKPHPLRRVKKQRQWSDAEILEQLRLADSEGAKTRSDYEQWRAVTGGTAPSWALITMRFGSWNNARGTAGLNVIESKAGAKRRFGVEETIASVKRFLVAADGAGVYPSSSAYQKWASKSNDLPSLSTIRVRTQMTWSEVVQRATRS